MEEAADVISLSRGRHNFRRVLSHHNRYKLHVDTVFRYGFVFV